MSQLESSWAQKLAWAFIVERLEPPLEVFENYGNEIQSAWEKLNRLPLSWVESGSCFESGDE